MPLQLPNLDDRRYDDLVAEALARIPTYSPQWTNHNPSDPGITLIELFAYLTDMLLYRLNRVTDDNTRKFLMLLNGPGWAEPSNTDLREEVRKAVLGIRERYRAVTNEDYEFLSTKSFNRWLAEPPDSYTEGPGLPEIPKSPIERVARAHCVPQRNLDAGTEADRLKPRPEHVSVVIVPEPQKGMVPQPGAQPSAAQIAALLYFLDKRRMLTTRLHVTGPYYVHVSAQLVIARNSDAVDAAVADFVNMSLAKLLDPLPSGDGSPGWPFGRDVYVSGIYQTLEKISGIDFITDVMLDSSCPADDSKCVVAEPMWHPGGDLVGLRLQDHHLPIFGRADVVIAPASAFIAVNLSVSAKAGAGADRAALNRSIKSTVRKRFHPAINGPNPKTGQPTDIFLSEVEVAIKTDSHGGLDSVSVSVDCVPADARRYDKDRGPFIHAAAGQVVDWRVAIQLS